MVEMFEVQIIEKSAENSTQILSYKHFSVKTYIRFFKVTKKFCFDKICAVVSDLQSK